VVPKESRVHAVPKVLSDPSAVRAPKAIWVMKVHEANAGQLVCQALLVRRDPLDPLVPRVIKAIRVMPVHVVLKVTSVKPALKDRKVILDPQVCLVPRVIQVRRDLKVRVEKKVISVNAVLLVRKV
jgi:hypothetical protein